MKDTYYNTFLLAIAAGVSIGIGGTAFLSIPNKVVGAVMFTVGLYTICLHGLALFTGKVGYAVEQERSYWKDLTIIWLGNWVGTYIAAQCILQTRYSSIAQIAQNMSNIKLADNYLSLLILGVFCGMLMYIAVEGYKKCQNPLILIACVAGFILCGFEHCIADMFYFSLAEVWSPKTLLITLVITVGNSIGGMLIPTVKYICSKSSER